LNRAQLRRQWQQEKRKTRAAVPRRSVPRD
jgi:hypothetical protein